MNRNITFTEGEFYHVYSRGVDRRSLFLDDPDRAHFQKLLFLANSTERINLRELPHGMSIYAVNRPETLVDIGAYAEMPNHIHIILHEKKERGITTFMSKLLTAYAKYFNPKARRTGALFDGRFRAKHINEDDYFHYLYGYVHLNPIKLVEPNWKEDGIKKKTEAEKFLQGYRFSSYLDFLGTKRGENDILNRDPFPDYFTKQTDFTELMNDMLAHDI